MDVEVIDGIIIGGVGGSIAGATVWLMNLIWEKRKEEKDKETVYKWLHKRWLADKKESDATGDEPEKWHLTRTIASYTNLTEDRVRYICSIHEDIVQSIGDKEDLWGILGIARSEENHNRGKC